MFSIITILTVYYGSAGCIMFGAGLLQEPQFKLANYASPSLDHTYDFSI